MKPGIQFDKFPFSRLIKDADFSGKTALILSVWFGSGLCPRASGTAGTLAALPLVIGASALDPLLSGIGLFLFILLAIWSAGVGAGILGKEDPGAIVIDEAAGVLLAFYLVPLSGLSLILGFLLFRAFDIVKPFPLSRLERIGGGKGIVLDDLGAGIYTNLVLRLVLPAIQGQP